MKTPLIVFQSIIKIVHLIQYLRLISRIKQKKIAVNKLSLFLIEFEFISHVLIISSELYEFVCMLITLWSITHFVRSG